MKNPGRIYLMLFISLASAPLVAQQPLPRIPPAPIVLESRSAGESPVPRPLRPPADTSGVQNPATPTASLTQSVVRVAASLAVVLALFFLLIWLLRRVLPRQTTQLPRQAFELLGSASISPRHTVQLLQFGNKLLLVSLTTGDASTLSEITDPAEVERLLAICQSGNMNSITTGRPDRVETGDFRQILDQVNENAVISSVRS